jgi:hypothetical protein
MMGSWIPSPFRARRLADPRTIAPVRGDAARVALIFFLPVLLGARAIGTLARRRWTIALIAVATVTALGIVEFRHHRGSQKPPSELQTQRETASGASGAPKELEQDGKSERDAMDAASISEWRKAVAAVLKEATAGLSAAGSRRGRGGRQSAAWAEDEPRSPEATLTDQGAKNSEPEWQKWRNGVEEALRESKVGQQVPPVGETQSGQVVAKTEDKPREPEMRRPDQGAQTSEPEAAREANLEADRPAPTASATPEAAPVAAETAAVPPQRVDANGPSAANPPLVRSEEKSFARGRETGGRKFSRGRRYRWAWSYRIHTTGNVRAPPVLLYSAR